MIGRALNALILIDVRLVRFVGQVSNWLPNINGVEKPEWEHREKESRNSPHCDGRTTRFGRGECSCK